MRIPQFTKMPKEMLVASRWGVALPNSPWREGGVRIEQIVLDALLLSDSFIVENLFFRLGKDDSGEYWFALSVGKDFFISKNKQQGQAVATLRKITQGTFTVKDPGGWSYLFKSNESPPEHPAIKTDFIRINPGFYGNSVAFLDQEKLKELASILSIL